MKRQVYFHIAGFSNGFWFVLFLRKRLFHFLCYLFMQEKIKWNSQKQSFADVLQNRCSLKISQCSRKHLCSSLFLKLKVLKPCIFIKKKVPTQVFSCEYCEIFNNSFLVEHFLFIILLLYFHVMIEFFRRLWAQNWRVSYFLYYCSVFLHNSSVRIGSPWLFRTCFSSKIFSKGNWLNH